MELMIRHSPKGMVCTHSVEHIAAQQFEIVSPACAQPFVVTSFTEHQFVSIAISVLNVSIVIQNFLYAWLVYYNRSY